MTSCERVLCALQMGIPDRVPWCEICWDGEVARKALGVAEEELSGIEIAQRLGIDNISVFIVAPFFVEKRASESGREFYGDGLIRTRKDLVKMEFPDPYDDTLYENAREAIAKKGNLAACAIIFLGIDPTWNSMGIEGFSYALADDPNFVEEVLGKYVDWYSVVAEKVCKLGFDFIWAADDIAFTTATIFSPRVYREIILPQIRKVAEKITLPWIYHSDGNLLPVLEDWISLGMNGMHPIEPEAMDIFELKKSIGRKVCLCGNIDINNLGMGTPESVEEEVKNKIERLSPGGGYIIGSSNSIPSYAKPENLLAMSRAIRKYGVY